VPWDDVAALIASTWASDDRPDRREVADGLARVLDALDETGWRRLVQEGLAPAHATAAEPAETGTVAVNEHEPDALSRGIRLAAATAVDGKQRALDVQHADLDGLLALRLTLRDALRASDDEQVRCVRPWLWRVETSGGEARTSQGRETGIELRLSRYAVEAEGKRRW
jgi:hypothetical protein